MLRVAVIGGGPSGSCAAEILAKSGIKTWLFERKLDNAKPCGGAIPLCMVEEFDLPETIIDRKVRHMKMISPSNREVDISLDNVYGKSDNEYIGMCRREVMDAFMRNRASELGATLINGLVTSIDTGNDNQGPYKLSYSDFSSGDKKGELKELTVDLLIGADGANSRVAKAMDAGDYKVAIAFQERIKLPKEEMSYYEDLAEMYVGTDVSPDFYGWVFPKYDHVAVGTGTMQKNQSLIKGLQEGVRNRAKKRLVNGEVIKVEEVDGPKEVGLENKKFKKISIFMNVFDCHVNRTPCSGIVEDILYKPGKFFNASLDKASEDNERNYYKIKDKYGNDIIVVQIAGLIARRIVCETDKNQELNQGDRIGMIRFGSRADVYYENYEPLVKVGQTAISGETLLAKK